MAKNDKEFGEWIATTIIGNKRSIKQFEKGFIIKDRGSTITNRIPYPEGTSHDDMVKLINGYFKE